MISEFCLGRKFLLSWHYYQLNDCTDVCIHAPRVKYRKRLVLLISIVISCLEYFVIMYIGNEDDWKISN